MTRVWPALRRSQRILAVVALSVFVGLGTAGCESDGPAEEAGEAIDRAADEIDDAVDPKGPVEKAGRAIDRAVDDATD